MTSMNIFVVGIFAQLFLQPVLSFTFPIKVPTVEEGKIPTAADAYRQWKETNPLNPAGLKETKQLVDLREQIFQRCMKGKSGYNTYEDYVKCKPLVDSEILKFIEAKKLGSTTRAYDNEIIKVESAENYDDEEDYFPIEFVDEPKHLNRRVGFFTKLWHRIIDGPKLNPFPLL